MCRGFRQEHLKQIIQKALAQQGGPHQAMFPHQPATLLGLFQRRQDGTERQAGALVEQAQRKALGQAQRVHHELKRQIGVRHRLAGLHLAALRHAGQIGRRLFVAHNARFDYGLLKNAFRRLNLNWQAPQLCTVKLSRLLYPQHHKHSLDSLIDRFQLGCASRHRALDDAEAAAQLAGGVPLLAWQGAAEWHRDSDLMAALATGLDLDAAAIDAAFIAADAIRG